MPIQENEKIRVGLFLGLNNLKLLRSRSVITTSHHRIIVSVKIHTLSQHSQKCVLPVSWFSCRTHTAVLPRARHTSTCTMLHATLYELGIHCDKLLHSLLDIFLTKNLIYKVTWPIMSKSKSWICPLVWEHVRSRAPSKVGRNRSNVRSSSPCHNDLDRTLHWRCGISQQNRSQLLYIYSYIYAVYGARKTQAMAPLVQH